MDIHVDKCVCVCEMKISQMQEFLSFGVIEPQGVSG